ncbi:ABC-type transport auxiliary lipoprotein family protein [Fundidesulfovibrio agrisoli]|uniref:ABC-type transport auxiliary lipoprotein family protein n=1 Tax=Fundidesulfovibrio agrisoli TaxID=2922717 RepID=UPI001FAC1423|nr:ABC-type transport auxiliary lipoprotein family protein [Fundidesulfovibrio agrisoli]
MRTPLKALILCLAAATLAACAASPLSRPAPDRRLFNISAQRPETAPAPKASTVLKVRPLQINPAFQGKEMVYRLGDSRFDSDYYNTFFTQPAQNLTGQARQWLGRAGLFGNVVDSTSQVADTHLLEGMVNALYGDFTDQGAPKAVLEIQFFLVSNKGEAYTVLFEKDYSRTVAFQPGGNDAAALARAYNTALAEILAELEGDIRQALANPSK